MTLYTSEVVAQHLDVTERRVRQLRDEGIIREKRPGLYNLVDAMTRYIKYVNAGSKVDLNDERAMACVLTSTMLLSSGSAPRLPVCCAPMLSTIPTVA